MCNEKSVSGSALAALLALAALALSQPASAHDRQQGMVAVRDPETGQLRAPTAAELRALRQQDTRLQPQVRPPSSMRPDGSRHAHLGDAGMVYSVTRRDAGGKLVTQCVKGDPAAAGDAAATETRERGHEHD